MATGPWDPITADAMDRTRLRASDVDREQVIDALKAAFVQGMLTKDELDMRAGWALASRTTAELAAITTDIPASLIPIQPPSKPVLACATKRVNKKVVAWGACVLVLPPALGTAFLTYYGGFLVLLVFAFIGTMASASPTASRQLGRPSDLDLPGRVDGWPSALIGTVIVWLIATWAMRRISRRSAGQEKQQAR